MAASHRLLLPRPAQLASSSSRLCGARYISQLNSRIRSLRIEDPLCRRLVAPPKARSASTSQKVAGDARSLLTRTKNFFLGTAIGLILVFGYYYITDTRAGVHQWVFVPSLQWIYDDAEEAHEVGIKALKSLYGFGLHPRERGNPDGAGDLQIEVRRLYQMSSI